MSGVYLQHLFARYPVLRIRGNNHALAAVIIVLLAIAAYVILSTSSYSQVLHPLRTFHQQTRTLPNDVIAFHLVLHWPAALCLIHNNNPSKADTCYELPGFSDDFYVHGLWPLDSNGIILAPNNLQCIGPPYWGEPFDLSKVQDVPVVESVWPDFMLRTDYEFWDYEYNRHGACLNPRPARILPQHQIITQSEYFRMVVQLKTRLQISQALGDDGIYPDDSQYSVKAVRDAIYKKYSVTPMLTCGRNGRDTLLWEVTFCVDKNGGLISCTFKAHDCGNGYLIDMMRYKSSVV